MKIVSDVITFDLKHSLILLTVRVRLFDVGQFLWGEKRHWLALKNVNGLRLAVTETNKM